MTAWTDLSSVVLVLRGEVRLVDLEPVKGSEANKRRPAVIVSNESANGTVAQVGRGVITVVPVTRSVRRVFEVLLTPPSRLSASSTM